MKAERPYPAYTVTPKAEAAILKGHPWVYADEITAAPDTAPENGAVVDVLSRKGRYLGSGLLSEASKIRVRLLSRNANDRFDEDFWRRRIEYAWAYRKAIYPVEDLQCCRVVFGETDSLPGVTVDRFGPILSVQILSYGMEKRKELLARLLVETLQADGQVIEGVFLRNDVALREKEGLSEGKGWLEVPGLVHPEKAETIITENGVRYHVDVENGQKTGFFLDQKLNRRRVAQLAKGRRVLDCFTHTGSFALNAAFGGAEHVTAVDVSEAAVEMARANAVLNGLDGRMDFVCADVFDLLPGLEGEQLPGHEAAAPGRHSGHRQLQPLCHPRHVREDAGGRGSGRRAAAAPDRGPPAGPRPPHPVERGGDELSEILSLPGGVRAAKTVDIGRRRAV